MVLTSILHESLTNSSCESGYVLLDSIKCSVNSHIIVSLSHEAADGPDDHKCPVRVVPT